MDLHYIYLLQEREFIKTKELIYKIGKTTKINHTRFKQYPKGSVLLLQTMCDDCHRTEKRIIQTFKNTFIQRRDIGTEYFEGDYKSMIDMIYAIIKKNENENANNEMSKSVKKLIPPRRKMIPCDEEDYPEHHCDKRVILEQIKKNEHNGKSNIHDNQREIATYLTELLHMERKFICIMVLALTQSGKTGAMVSLIKEYLTYHDDYTIPIDNIFIITGLSSIEWVSQTKRRMPHELSTRIYHRDRLIRHFAKDIKDKKDVLIIVDEIHIAARENQTLHRVFKEANIYDKQFMCRNDIKIVEFSATPDGTIYDLLKWKDNAHKCKMEAGDGYVSCFDLRAQDRVFQYKDLLCCKNSIVDFNKAQNAILEIKDIIDYNFDEPRYHIIRTANGQYSQMTIDNFIAVFGHIKYVEYSTASEALDINKLLKCPPKVDTFIFIKEKLRCAKTIHKTHLGIIYERWTPSPDDTVIIQGLVGRGTGYDDNGDSIYFTNLKSIEKYEKLWNSEFGSENVNWHSKTTRSIGNKLLLKTTFNYPQL